MKRSVGVTPDRSAANAGAENGASRAGLGPGNHADLHIVKVNAAEVDVRAVEPDDGEVAVAGSVPDGFRVVDGATASWAVRKIVEARAYAARVREWAGRELRAAERDEEWLLRRFGCELEEWLRAELGRRGGRRRSVALPAGTIGLRQQPARLEVLDEAAVLAWCELHLPVALRVTAEAEGPAAGELARWQREHAGDVRVRRQVLREPLARHLDESGELPDGTAVAPAVDRFYVK